MKKMQKIFLKHDNMFNRLECIKNIIHHIEISVCHCKYMQTQSAFDPVSNVDAIEQINTPSNSVSSRVTIFKPNKLRI